MPRLLVARATLLAAVLLSAAGQHADDGDYVHVIVPPVQLQQLMKVFQNIGRGSSAHVDALKSLLIRNSDPVSSWLSSICQLGWKTATTTYVAAQSMYTVDDAANVVILVVLAYMVTIVAVWRASAAWHTAWQPQHERAMPEQPVDDEPSNAEYQQVPPINVQPAQMQAAPDEEPAAGALAAAAAATASVLQQIQAQMRTPGLAAAPVPGTAAAYFATLVNAAARPGVRRALINKNVDDVVANLDYEADVEGISSMPCVQLREVPYVKTSNTETKKARKSRAMAHTLMLVYHVTSDQAAMLRAVVTSPAVRLQNAANGVFERAKRLYRNASQNGVESAEWQVSSEVLRQVFASVGGYKELKNVKATAITTAGSLLEQMVNYQ